MLGAASDPDPGQPGPIDVWYLELAPGFSIIHDGPRALHTLTYQHPITIYLGHSDANEQSDMGAWRGLFTLSPRDELTLGLTAERTNTRVANLQSAASQSHRGVHPWWRPTCCCNASSVRARLRSSVLRPMDARTNRWPAHGRAARRACSPALSLRGAPWIRPRVHDGAQRVCAARQRHLLRHHRGGRGGRVRTIHRTGHPLRFVSLAAGPELVLVQRVSRRLRGCDAHRSHPRRGMGRARSASAPLRYNSEGYAAELNGAPNPRAGLGDRTKP